MTVGESIAFKDGESIDLGCDDGGGAAVAIFC